MSAKSPPRDRFAATLGNRRGTPGRAAHPLLGGGAAAAGELAGLLALLDRGDLDGPAGALDACRARLYEDLPAVHDATHGIGEHWAKATRLASGNCAPVEALLVAFAHARSITALRAPTAAAEAFARSTGLLVNAHGTGELAAAIGAARSRALCLVALVQAGQPGGLLVQQDDRATGALDAAALAVLLADWMAPDPLGALGVMLGPGAVTLLREHHGFDAWVRASTWELWQGCLETLLAEALPTGAGFDPADAYEHVYATFDGSFDEH